MSTEIVGPDPQLPAGTVALDEEGCAWQFGADRLWRGVIGGFAPTPTPDLLGSVGMLTVVHKPVADLCDTAPPNPEWRHCIRQVGHAGDHMTHSDHAGKTAYWQRSL